LLAEFGGEPVVLAVAGGEDHRDAGVDLVHVAEGLVAGHPRHGEVEDDEVEGLLFCGTDLGVYASRDHGETWDAVATDLPTTYVHDLDLQERDDILVAGTHGRGVWAIDVRALRDPEAARQAAEEAAAERRARRGGRSQREREESEEQEGEASEDSEQDADEGEEDEGEEDDGGDGDGEDERADG